VIRIVFLLFLLATAGPAWAWRMAESAHFRVFTQGSADSATKKALLLEDYRDLLILATGRKPPDDAPKLDVYLVRDLRAATPGRSLGSTVAGFYRATPGGIAAVSGGGAGGPDWAQAVLLHEYAHHFMLGDTSVAYPAWYVEGFAEYFMTARFEPERVEFGHVDSGRIYSLLSAGWLPPERLLRGTSDMRRSSDVAMFYAQSWLLTHWLFRTEGMTPKFRAYLARTANGEDPVEAFRKEVDPELSGLNPKLRRYLESGKNFTYSRMKRSPPETVPVTVVDLPKSADDWLLPLLAIEQGVVPDETGGKLLADLRAAAGKAPEDAFLARGLARAELAFGDPKAALALLEPLVAAAPADPVLLRWRGMAIIASDGDVGAARRSFVAAFKADPNDWRTLMAWARTLPPDRLTDQQLDVILRAHALAPQVSDSILTAAVALGHRGRMKEAANVLRPLAHNPHGGRRGEFAERLLELAAAGDQPGFLAAIRMPQVPPDSE
jgi:tetratricopeptide (TPR) repeat protein